MRRTMSLAFLVLSAASVFGQTSLFIPGFDPQPISADILGVDAQGRTTWALHAGSPTGTFSSGDGGFVGTATLVEGPKDASLTYAAPGEQFTVGIACSLSDTLAVCSSAGATATETVDRFAVQVGTSAPAPSTGSPTTPQSSPSQTSGNTSSPSPSSSNARNLTPYFSGIFILSALVAAGGCVI